MSKLNAIRSIPGIKACVTLQNRPRSRPLAGISSGVCHVWMRRKNLAPSQATAKEHSRRPRQGLRSARRNQTGTQTFVDTSITPIPATVPPPHTVQTLQANQPTFNLHNIMYHNNTGDSLLHHYRDVCFFILYHYESNAIPAIPINNIEDATIFAAYKDWFEYLESREYKPKLNIMDKH